MKIRTVLVVVLALICGASAMVGVSQLTSQHEDAPIVETEAVVIMSKNMPRGSVLSPEVVTVAQWPKGSAPQGALQTVEETDGRSVLVPLVAGEPVLQAKLASKDAGRGLAAMIPRGMRAFTINTSHVAAGVGGFILPGNHVDVLLTTTSSGSQDPTGGGATTTLLQNVQILAVAQRLDAPDTNKMDPKDLKSITVLVTPDQAAKLDLGMNKGILHLSLRNPEDDREADTRPATMAQLRFHQDKPNIDPFRFAKLVGAFAGSKGDAGEESEAAPKRRARQSAHVRTLRGLHRGGLDVQ